MSEADKKLRLILQWYKEADAELKGIPITSIADVAQRTAILCKFFAATGFTVEAYALSNTDRTEGENKP